MKTRLSKNTRIRLTKLVSLLTALLAVAVAFALVPAVAEVLPRRLGEAMVAALIPHTESEAAKDAFALADEPFLYPESLPEGEFEEEPSIPEPPAPGDTDLMVTPKNLCWYDHGEAPQLFVIDRTSYGIDLNGFAKKDYPISTDFDPSLPLVLIIHTHGSESYLPAGYDFYSPDETFRSEDPQNTVVAVGALLAETLNSLGVPTVHDTTMYDTKDFNSSYVFSREGILTALGKYPSLKYVIDLHRDSVFDSDGNNIKPLTLINGKECAQLMLVAGTDEGGAQHPNWRTNMTVAAQLQQKLNLLYPTLMRPVNIRQSAFNQALTPGSLLLEVGSCGNTIEEAKNAVVLFADAYAKLLKGIP